MNARIYRQVERGLPVQRRPPVRRPRRLTTCSALLSFLRSQLSTWLRTGYFCFGGSEPGIAELVPGDVGELLLDDGAGAVDEGGVDGGVVGGGVVDVDDFGVTTGGVFGLVDVFVSRWQPATPSASPAQSNVTKAVLLIVFSNR